MSGTWKDGAQKSVYGVQDDLRHTYEQVFFGRQTTGNNAADLPEDAKQAGPADPGKEKSPAEELYGPDAEPTHEEREATAFAYTHASNAPGIRAEIEAATGQPYRYGDAPDIPNNSETNAHARIDFYGSDRGGADRAAADASDLYGHSATPGPGDGGGIHGPSTDAPATDAEELYGPAMDSGGNGAPQIEGPKIEPPNQGNDNSPGY